MTTRQLKAMWAGLLPVVLLLIAPPWKFTLSIPNPSFTEYREHPGPYAFVFFPPKIPLASRNIPRTAQNDEDILAALRVWRQPTPERTKSADPNVDRVFAAFDHFRRDDDFLASLRRTETAEDLRTAIRAWERQMTVSGITDDASHRKVDTDLTHVLRRATDADILAAIRADANENYDGYYDAYHWEWRTSIDWPRCLLPVAAVALATVSLIVTFREKRSH